MKRWHMIAGLAISGLALAYLASLLDLPTIWQQLKRADWLYVALACFFYAAGFPSRAWRWQVILSPVGRSPFGPLLSALVIGHTVSALLPLRLGELARIYAAGRFTGLSYGSILASLVVERVLDGLTLLVVLFVSLLSLSPSAVGGGFSVSFMRSAGYGLLSLYLVVLCLAFALHFAEDKVVSLAKRLLGRVSARLAGLAAAGLSSFAAGLAVIRSPWRWLAAIVLSLVSWGTTLGVFWLFLPACGLPAKAVYAGLALSGAALAAVVPAGPGFVGTVQVAMYWGLLLAGAPAAPALVYSLLLWVVTNGVLAVGGMMEMARQGLTLGGLKRASQEAANGAE